MTPRELTGWVPSERHEHFDVDGNLTGYTVVTRESRIDDVDLADLLAVMRYRREVCSCGFHPSVAQDKANGFRPEDAVCPVCAAQEQWRRRLHAADEAFAKTNPDAPALARRPSDGRRSWMRWLSPDETAAEEASRRARGGPRGHTA